MSPNDVTPTGSNKKLFRIFQITAILGYTLLVLCAQLPFSITDIYFIPFLEQLLETKNECYTKGKHDNHVNRPHGLFSANFIKWDQFDKENVDETRPFGLHFIALSIYVMVHIVLSTDLSE